MPKMSRWMIRCALLYLALGFFIGALLLSKKAFPGLIISWKFLLLHTEILIFGWTLQLVMGVAYWILPRFPEPRPRGRLWPVFLAFFLLNGGIVLVILADLNIFPAAAQLLGRVMEAGAVLAFAGNAWPRVKGFSEPKSA